MAEQAGGRCSRLLEGDEWMGWWHGGRGMGKGWQQASDPSSLGDSWRCRK